MSEKYLILLLSGRLATKARLETNRASNGQQSSLSPEHVKVVRSGQGAKGSGESVSNVCVTISSLIEVGVGGRQKLV